MATKTIGIIHSTIVIMFNTSPAILAPLFVFPFVELNIPKKSPIIDKRAGRNISTITVIIDSVAS